MAESQHHHRQGLESHVIHSNVSAQKLGTILGFIVAMTVVIGGMYLVHEGKSAAGLSAILTALASLVGVFLYSKREQQKDLANKTEALAATTPQR
jgi:flagellar motor component MotA